MGRRIFLVSAKKSFMVNAMVKNLVAESFEVVQGMPVIKDFERMKEDKERSDFMLVYMDGDVDEMAEFLVYVKDQLAADEEDLKVYLIGNEGEIETALQFLPRNMVEGTFHRPLNVKDLAEKMHSAAAASDARDGRKKILVVDDDGTMLRTLKFWLSDHYQVYMANSGMNALSLLARKDVDLILLDYEMPVASGPQVLEMIRSEPATKDMPVMFLTAKNDKESIMKVMALKPEKYLLKTMPPDVLLQNIDDFFTSQRMAGKG